MMNNLSQMRFKKWLSFQAMNYHCLISVNSLNSQALSMHQIWGGGSYRLETSYNGFSMFRNILIWWHLVPLLMQSDNVWLSYTELRSFLQASYRRTDRPSFLSKNAINLVAVLFFSQVLLHICPKYPLLFAICISIGLALHIAPIVQQNGSVL